MNLIEATDLRMGRPVAVKRISRALAAITSIRERFFEEVDAAMRAEIGAHQVVRVYDKAIDSANGQPYLLTLLVEPKDEKVAITAYFNNRPYMRWSGERDRLREDVHVLETALLLAWECILPLNALWPDLQRGAHGVAATGDFRGVDHGSETPAAPVSVAPRHYHDHA